jgi:hypothetical protein
MPLAFKVGCPSSGAGCDIASVFILLCVGLMAIFCDVTSYFGFLSIGVYLVFQSSCGVYPLLEELLCVQVSLCVVRPKHVAL